MCVSHNSTAQHRKAPRLDRDTSLMILVAGIAATVAGLLGDRARSRAPLAPHALLPWHAVIFAGLLAVVLMAAHLLGAK